MYECTRIGGMHERWVWTPSSRALFRGVTDPSKGHALVDQENYKLLGDFQHLVSFEQYQRIKRTSSTCLLKQKWWWGAPTRAEKQHIRDVLEAAGITCYARRTPRLRRPPPLPLRGLAEKGSECGAQAGV